jgi:hypothetical protein
MNNNYLFYYTNLNYLPSDDQLIIEQYAEVHIWGDIIYESKNSIVYYYATNEKQLLKIQNNLQNAHLTFIGDEIFNDYYLNTLDLNLERFWFPNETNLNNTCVEKFLKLKNIKNIPICISYNSLIQPNIIANDFFNFINLIYSKYQNPLIKKEEDLIDSEIFDSKNLAIIRNDDTVSYNNIVLGLHGDFIFKFNEHINLKDKTCLICEHCQTCDLRGLGIIKKFLNYKKCIGIELFTP